MNAFIFFNSLPSYKLFKECISQVLAYKQEKLFFTKLTRNEGLGVNIREADGLIHRKECDIGWVWSEHHWHWTPDTRHLDSGYSCCGWNEFSTDFLHHSPQSDSEVVAYDWPSICALKIPQIRELFSPNQTRTVVIPSKVSIFLLSRAVGRCLYTPETCKSKISPNIVREF